MKNLATWCVVAAVAVVAAGWGALDAVAQPKSNPKRIVLPRKTEPDDKKVAGAIGDAAKKAPDAAVKSPYALYGEEAALCMDRFHVVLENKMTEADKFWRTDLPKGKSAQEEWQALASALCEDLDLYGRSAIDSAKDARKDKKSRATEADVGKLKARVDKTIKLADHVFRKKGQEVAIFRDTAHRASETMRGFKTSMPLIEIGLQADSALAADNATYSREKWLKGEPSLSSLDWNVRTLELARRSVQAVIAVGLTRRATLTILVKALAPEIILANCQKATDNWVADDLTADTLLSAKQTEDVQGWPREVERRFGKGYAAAYAEGRKAVSPFVEGNFHQLAQNNVFKNTAIADMDKVMASYLNEAKAALEARRAMEASQKDAEHAEKLADEELKSTRAAGKKTGEVAKSLGGKIRDMRMKYYYESDRRLYQDLSKKAVELTTQYDSLFNEFEEKDKDLESLKKTRVASKSPAYKDHVEKITQLRRAVKKLQDRLEQIGADLEEVFEELDQMRAAIRGEPGA